MGSRNIRELQALNKITPQERVLWQLILDFCTEHGYSPSIYELADMSKLHAVTVFRRLSNMRRKGYVDMPVGAKRAVKVYPIAEEGMDNDKYPGSEKWVPGDG